MFDKKAGQSRPMVYPIWHGNLYVAFELRRSFYQMG